MLVGSYSDKPAESQTRAGIAGTVMRKLIARDEGARVFTMRMITIDVGGHIGLHDHPWEHEIFVVHGEGQAFTGSGRTDIKPGNFIWIPPNEEHGFENTGSVPLEFICCIPLE